MMDYDVMYANDLNKLGILSHKKTIVSKISIHILTIIYIYI